MIKKNKIWKIKGFEGTFTDEELVSLIKAGEVKPDYFITSKEMKKWVKVSNSIYQFYIGGEHDENI